MGPKVNYKCGALVYNLVCRFYLVSFVDVWGLRASLGRIRHFEIEFGSHFSI